MISVKSIATIALMVFVFGELLLHHGAQSYSNNYSKFSSVSKRSVLQNPVSGFRSLDTKIPSQHSLLNLVKQTIETDEQKPANTMNTIAKATLFTSSINLLKNCVGAGVFSLNSRVSAITVDPSHFKFVVMLIFGMALWAVYNFYIVGETCRLTKSSTFGEAWSKTVSANSRWIVQFVITAAPIVSCVANTIVLSDVLKLILQVVGAPSWIYTSRPYIVLVLCTFILFPICIVKDLSTLKSVSVVGIVGQLTAMIALAIRLLDGSYKLGGKYYETANIGHQAIAAANAATSSSGTVIEPFALSKWFILASLLSYCFVTHYNAPRYYTELAGKEEQPMKFLQMTSLSYFTAASVYVTTIIIATRLFGPYSQSFALNSFSSLDPLGLIAFLAFGTSVLASFPLIFFSMRNWFIQQATRSAPAIANVSAMTALLLTLIGGITILCNDIGKVGSVAGAVFGSSMMFIFPPVMYINALLKQSKSQEEVNDSEKQLQEDSISNKISSSKLYALIAVNGLLFSAGLVVAVIGTINSLQNFFSK